MTISKLKKGYKLEDKLNHILFNPESSEVEQDTAFILTNDQSFDYKSHEKFVVSGAGEYEIKDISVYAYDSANSGGFDISKIIIENIGVCYLAETINAIPKTISEELGNVDLLVLEISSMSLFDNKVEMIQDMEPKQVLLLDLGNGLAGFEKEYSSEIEKIKKLKVKDSDFTQSDSQEVKVITLE